MSGLTRGERAEPVVSRGQILRRERGQGKIIFLLQLNTSRMATMRRPSLVNVMTIHQLSDVDCAVSETETLKSTECGRCYALFFFCFFFGCMVASRGGYRMARGRRYAKLSLSNAARLSFYDLCILLFLFLSLCRLCVCVFLCSHWSLVDVPLIFFCPADHVPDWQPRVLLGMVEARSVNVKKTTTTTIYSCGSSSSFTKY